MGSQCSIAVLSDIHYAAAAEQARGGDYESRISPDRWCAWRSELTVASFGSMNLFKRMYLLGIDSLSEAEPDYVFANGD